MEFFWQILFGIWCAKNYEYYLYHFYLYSYSVKELNPNIICICIWSSKHYLLTSGFILISNVCFWRADVSARFRAHFKNARSYKSNFRHVIHQNANVSFQDAFVVGRTLGRDRIAAGKKRAKKVKKGNESAVLFSCPGLRLRKLYTNS